MKSMYLFQPRFSRVRLRHDCFFHVRKMKMRHQNSDNQTTQNDLNYFCNVLRKRKNSILAEKGTFNPL